jgi:hypothetical protein
MPDQQEEQNRAMVESLLKSFAPIARRLTPEIEPAVIYSPGEHIDSETDDSE